MHKLTLTLVMLGLMALPALGLSFYDYDWDGTQATDLGRADPGTEGACTVDANCPEGVGGGLTLTVTDQYSRGSRTFLASVWGLQEGDHVTVSIWQYDETPGAGERMRLAAHYNNSLVEEADARGQDLAINHGERSFTDWPTQIGWQQVAQSWTIESGFSGLVIDADVFGSVGETIQLDLLRVWVPDHASVRMPDRIYTAGGDVVANQVRSLSQIKALFQ
jgi:hypothetical protein